jgi:arylsulfatase A-like enzyme
VFENAAAPMPLTLPSHFSLMTSRYPREHGVLNNRIQLPDSALTLAEIFSANGYQTGAFVSVALLDRASGAGQGFDVHRYPTNPRERRAIGPIGEALHWADSLSSDAPFFLWVHVFEPHLPYAPATHKGGSTLDPKLFAQYPTLNWKDFYAIAKQNGGDIPSSVFEHAKAMYRAEIEDVDRWIGLLLDGLRQRDLLSNTITVLTADHGEPFENGVYFEHSDSLYDGAIRIPLMVNYPPSFPAGKRVDTQVSIIDIAPSLLAAAGIEIPGGYSGLALQDAERFDRRGVLIQYPFYHPAQAASRPSRRAVIKTVAGRPVEASLVGRERVGIVDSNHKLIRTGTDQLALYNRAGPHGRDERIAAPKREVLAALNAELSRLLEDHPLELIDSGMINDELLENLKALGYAE